MVPHGYVKVYVHTGFASVKNGCPHPPDTLNEICQVFDLHLTMGPKVGDDFYKMGDSNPWFNVLTEEAEAVLNAEAKK